MNPINLISCGMSLACFFFESVEDRPRPAWLFWHAALAILNGLIGYGVGGF